VLAFIDLTEIPVCYRKRIQHHKAIAKQAALGKSSKDCFLSFKLHLVANRKVELVAIIMTPGNVDYRNPVSHMTSAGQGRIIHR